MSLEPPEFDEALEAYLDGTMPAERRADFARERGAALSEASAGQARIDGALRQQFGGAGMTVPPLPEAAAGPRAYRRAAWWRDARVLAAAGLLVAVGVWAAIAGLGGGADTLAAVYAREVDGGLVPGWVCETDAEFAQTFEDQFKQPLLAAAAPGVELIGLTYNYALEARTVMVLARVDGEPVIVFTGPTRLVTETPSVGSQSLNLFERQIGQVRLFEVTPLDEPRVLPGFYEPESEK